MTAASYQTLNPDLSQEAFVEKEIARRIDTLITSLPDVDELSADERRGIIARYTAVLEGNFIYWMTGAYLSARSDDARAVIIENLHEEVRDSHPAMLRRFALAAHAMPRESDIMDVHQDLTNVRLFVGGLAPVRVILMMAFFEGFIQRFMDFLERLAVKQGSDEREYTQVHGVCDIAHSRELFRAVAAEIALSEPQPAATLFEGIDLLCPLITAILATGREQDRALAAATSHSRES